MYRQEQSNASGEDGGGEGVLSDGSQNEHFPPVALESRGSPGPDAQRVSHGRMGEPPPTRASDAQLGAIPFSTLWSVYNADLTSQKQSKFVFALCDMLDMQRRIAEASPHTLRAEQQA
jgi:hypothetical protein